MFIPGTSGNDFLQGSSNSDTIRGYEGNDRLIGGDGIDWLYGDEGRDYLDGGHDGFRADHDHLYGGDGDDTYVIRSEGSGGITDRIYERPDEGRDTVITYTWRYNTLEAYLENLDLRGLATTGFGNADNNFMYANPLYDSYLQGNGGRDILYGSTKNDTLDGGIGNNRLTNGYQFSGEDYMSGGPGDDVYYVDSSGDEVYEQANAGRDTVISYISYTLPDQVEYLELGGSAYQGTGNNLDNYIRGNRYANILNGRGGNDILNGNGGEDTLLGERGNDAYFVNSSGDRVIDVANGGIDHVYSSVDFTLGDHLEHLTMEGRAYRGHGNRLNNLINGNSFNNSLNGSVGNDTLNGGSGDDILDGYALEEPNEVDTLSGGSGADLFSLQDDSDIYQGLTIILDFNVFEGDRISLPGSGSSTLTRFNLSFAPGSYRGISGAYLYQSIRAGSSTIRDDVAFFQYNAAGGIGNFSQLVALFEDPARSPIV